MNYKPDEYFLKPFYEDDHACLSCDLPPNLNSIPSTLRGLDMATKKTDKPAIDAKIIELLMLSDNDLTATDIAKSIGLKKAKDVNGRLTSLHNRDIISKLKMRNSVFWSIEQLDGKPQSRANPPEKEYNLDLVTRRRFGRGLLRTD